MTIRTTTIMICNRCGRTVKKDDFESYDRWRKLTFSGTEHDLPDEDYISEGMFDLCPTCCTALKRWMLRKENVST